MAHYRVPLFLLAFALAYGVLGYWLLAGWSFVDALYMTVIALSTVGFQEVQPLSTGERMFTISVILIGVGAVFTAIGLVTEHAASGVLGRELRRLRVKARLDKLNDHVIVCGYGRVGQVTVAELVASGEPTLVIDKDDRLSGLPGGDGIVWLHDDATHEAVLEQAGIRKARALVTAIGSDAVNVYITLTARMLNPDLNIIALATDPEAHEQLLRAGADRVTSLSAIGGHNLASHALRPNLADFIDMSTASSEQMVQEVTVTRDSPLAGTAIRDLRGARTRVERDEVAVVGLRSRDGEMVTSPSVDLVLGVGDIVILWGTPQARQALVEGDRASER
ncbi:MAG: potassium channel family protein [Miltoncostaeaceae bacterium]